MLKLVENEPIKLTSYQGKLSDKAYNHLMFIRAKESEHKYQASLDAFNAYLKQTLKQTDLDTKEGEKCV